MLGHRHTCCRDNPRPGRAEPTVSRHDPSFRLAVIAPQQRGQRSCSRARWGRCRCYQIFLAVLAVRAGSLEIQEAQARESDSLPISDSNDNDPNEPENKISWYIVEDGPYSMCIMGFNPEEADDFENDAAEDRTTFYLIGQG
eukprot:scaffold53356_cov65-Phaeocystis_antarctica.AAC.1